MINVLIVDDDKLVRMGLSSALPWEEFGMRVVGEAGNGEKALEFCGENEVNLMIVDLSMPVMSGLDLMRVCSQRFPDIRFVVLTFHQEISYVQEALRIGALDYITKAEFEKENFRLILGRISDIYGKAVARSAPSLIGAQEVFCLISLDAEGGEHWQTFFPDISGEWEIVDHGFWMFIPSEAGELDKLEGDLAGRDYAKRSWGFIRFTNMGGISRPEAFRQLRHYRYSLFFYDLQEINTVLIRDFSLAMQIPVIDEASRAGAEEMISSMNWCRSRDELESVLEYLKATAMPISQLSGLLGEVVHKWNRVYSRISGETVSMPESFTCFPLVEKWMGDLTERSLTLTGKGDMSPEILRSMERAINIINHDYASNLLSEDVARQVYMSRSHFYTCFTEFTGKTYREYLKDVRLDRAVDYLEKTSKSVSFIAESVGYLDTKYFSGLFKEKTGLTPLQYRKSMKENRDSRKK